jgi:ribosomal protein S18 acetylase RimI-like enzyme
LTFIGSRFLLDFAASLRENLRMSDTIVLRAAAEADASVLAATIATSFAQYRGKLVPESGAFQETADSIAAELKKGAGAFIAERNGETLGCVMTKPMEGDLYFGRLSVLPAARGSGVAKRLIEAVEADARARGMPGVRLGVRVVLTDNQRLFASMGYRETDREAHPGFDYPTSINMRKRL